ncbi:hypothetical protein SCUCBS95973_000211 [Sporothrix curviconia]|uniref:Uncharacterized protein n=1 Tax=Sporothrix curviconia TaxID=1260050 RepID=A0ABP0AND6_9PEZI
MDEAKHTRLTRPVQGAYAMSSLIEFEPLIDSTSRAFVTQMEQRFAKQNKICPLDQWMQMYAFDVTGEVTVSKRIGFLDTGKDVDQMMHYTGQALDYTGIIGQVPWLDWYFRIKNPILCYLRPTSNVLSFTMKQIREHEKSPKGQTRDLLSRFMLARDKNPDLIDEVLLNDYTNLNVSGGSDTTAIILRTLIYQLLTQPAVYAKVMGEIKATLQARPDNEDKKMPISWAEGQKMTYYQACIKEALRNHPATAQILPRYVPEGGVQLCGRFLPQGTVVGFHRDKALYGDDADAFRPERWLEAAPEHAKKMETLLLTFGGGKRACIGKNIAMLEITKFVPELLRRLDMKLIDPSHYRVKSTWLAVQSGLDNLYST